MAGAVCSPGRRRGVIRYARARGIVLVTVLWIVLLLAVMAASAGYTARTETRLTRNALESARARALAEAGIAYAATRLLPTPDLDDPWPVQGSPRRWRFGDGEAVIRVTDSVGKVDINHASRDLLGGVLAAVGVDADTAETLLDAIEDWRDPDELKRLNGAELDEYLAAGRATGPKNAPFESVEELQQVLGIDAVLYRRLAELITVSGHQGVNPEAASLELLLAVPDVEPGLIEEYVQLRDEALLQDLPPPPPPPLGAYLSRSKGLAYHVVVEAVLDVGARTTVRAVITQARRPGQAFHIVSWDES